MSAASEPWPTTSSYARWAGITDADIAHDALAVLKHRPDLANTVQIAVHHGHVTLTGQVEWLLQKETAEHAIEHVPGLLGVFNHITVKPRSMQRDVQRRIASALHHHADLDAHQIRVAVEDGAVQLTGTVRTWTERGAAERAAGSAPGIRSVDNQIVVVPFEPPELDVPDEMC